MSNPKDGRSTTSRQFEVAEKLGELEGTIASLGKRLSDHLASFSPPDLSNQFEQVLVNTLQSEKLSLASTPPAVVTMTTKNKITFSGQSTENVDDFVDQIGYLAIANKYTEEQKYAQTLLSLKGPALQWFKGQDAEKDYKGTDGKLSATLLHTALKSRFKPDNVPGDVMMTIMSSKMLPSETVDSFLTRILPYFSKLSSVDEEIQAGILINLFVPQISDVLRVKGDLNTLAEVERFARRAQDMKSGYIRPMNVPNPQEVNQTTSNPKPVACFKCGGPHYIRECPYNFQNVYATNVRGRGRGRYNFPRQYAPSSMQNPMQNQGYPNQNQGFPNQFSHQNRGFPNQFPRGVFHHRPRIQNVGQYGGYRPPYQPRGFVQRGSFYRPSHPQRGSFYGPPQPNHHQVNLVEEMSDLHLHETVDSSDMYETFDCSGMYDTFDPSGMYNPPNGMNEYYDAGNAQSLSQPENAEQKDEKNM